MFFSKAQKQVGVAFDIGTASVSATLFEISPEEIRPNLIKTFRKFHKISPKKDATHFGKSTTVQFSELIKEIDTFLKGKVPSYYVIGLSSIFYLGRTEKLYEKRPENKAVTKSDIETFLENGKHRFLSGLDRDDVVVFETVPMRILLNGYTVEQPVGKTAAEIELSVYYAATSRELYDTLIAIIWSVHKNAQVRFSTLPIATWLVMREVLVSEHSAIIADIGGELTEVTFLADGIIEGILSLPFGVMNILLRISEIEHIEVENALSLLKNYTSGMLDKDAESRIRAILKKELKGWEEVFDRVWQKASRDMMSNIKMFFLGGGALITDMKTAVTPPLLHPDLARNLHVSMIAPEAFRDRFGTYCCFDGPGDFGLLALILSVRS
ncbi:MAG: hypothetical protein UX74_C0007G0016 [Parcubacteria group bacterium GW2011_GWA2_47_10b]|uniref:SHS2 domain-containing protein n=1 Tax=Candidatus Ryanbacteria bacterium RIFCSPLOWO2_02_FULL_47_14 TaxID=1802129 RepID=A0A1G2H0Y9_9BACT|nr:MAG: hypothetical protein UX74_C0007G0016 [Parcubacteria group bacterium GW2011_GWA2_47_10b]KKU85500.1 MAG: hypothetical protein UY14_C0022G0003 [Parcubacteria group bacterium GW2011_GWA1_47_9]OGZ44656.1 MAG: hypothetical protein A2844_00240 [Candidatus Ryanbacteria bacterium RIFCSPHIGHO2_01_FULL_48_80]OGZ48167.1 MAG: hypothetical protein A3C83_03365 [Candidatus Ryanbacteria bacterium RIFCSPHIGHO2_02_FULL_47_25]OGZ51789.1 MAG: hypothetical protein A3A29_00595 [Candidatus Ryanbacteria bacteri